MKAAVLSDPRKPLVIEDLKLAPPKAAEVRVRVAANGACHSDLHVMTGDMKMPLPLVLGHVVLTFSPVCGHCRYCTQGQVNLCETRPKGLGTLLDGTTRLRKNGTEIFHFAFASTFAEEAVVPESCAIKIRDDVPLDRACFVGCGTMTGIGAAINTAKVRPGASVAVIGCGGVGLNVIQGAALAGAAGRSR